MRQALRAFQWHARTRTPSVNADCQQRTASDRPPCSVRPSRLKLEPARALIEVVVVDPYNGRAKTSRVLEIPTKRTPALRPYNAQANQYVTGVVRSRPRLPFRDRSPCS